MKKNILIDLYKKLLQFYKVKQKPRNILQRIQAAKSKIFKSIGSTKLITFENYIIEGSNIIFDNNNRIIKSNDKSVITDKDKNNIYLDSFEFQINKNIFKSIGYIKIEDINNNSYQFPNISDILNTYISQISSIELIQKQYKLLLNKIDFFLLKNCKHEWEEDIIELQNEYMKSIKYCSQCHLNAN